MTLRFVALLFALWAGLATAQNQIADGIPYIYLEVTPQNNASFDETYFKTQVGVWVRTNQASNAPNLQVPTDVIFGLTTPYDTYPIETQITLSSSKYGSGYIQEALRPLVDGGAISTIFGTDFVINSAAFVPNYIDKIAINFDSFGRQYVNSWTADLRMYLNFAPRPGTSVTVSLNNPNLQSNPATITIAYPATQAYFKLFSSVVGNQGTSARSFTTTDSNTEYQFMVGTPTLQVDALAQVNIVPPNPAIINYNMTQTEAYSITVPSSYRDATLRLVVTVKSNPAGLTLSATNISITQRNVPYYFYATGPVGTFTLSYVIAAPWNAASANNNYFANPTTTNDVTFVEALNITVGSIPDAYMVNPPATTDYGGAYSRLINVYIEKSPKKNLILYISAPNCEVYPPQISFSSTGSTMQQFYARGLVTGLRTFTFSLGGQSAADYLTPSQKFWRVHGPNPTCRNFNDETACFGINGCQWNADRMLCSNSSLPISIARIPTLFDGEASTNVSLTLATAVRTNLRIQFVAASRLVFSPALLVLGAGTKSVNFTVTGYLAARDGIVQQSFYLRLSGSDANYFQQVEGVATVRPKIQCEIKTPAPFYVGTESDVFEVSCDGPPETEVYLTPVPSNGITFVALGMHVGSAMYMNSLTSTGTFYAVSTNGVVGTFNIAITFSGVNAARYEEVAIVTIRTLPLATLNPLPNFYFTQYETTPELHVDLSALPPNPLYVSMTILNELGEVDNGNITLTPASPLMFNSSTRQLVSVTGVRPGNYTIRYNISGINYRNYEPTANSTFECKYVEDGNAFTYRLKLGFQPKTACRVNVGRNAMTFKGQNQVDVPELFCANVPQLWANRSNGTTVCPAQKSEERCRAALQRDGTVCAWFKDECTFLPQLQGSVKDVAYGSGYILFLAKNGSVYSIGSINYGQLGHFNEDGLDHVVLPENISSVVTGIASSYALSVYGRVYAWGANNKGQLGINKNIQQTESIYEITFPRYENISCISAGSMHAGAVSLSGKVYMWGSNEFGQTGNLATFRDYSRAPIVVDRDYFDGDVVTTIQCGEYHTMVATDANAYTFGNNNQGQLGRAGYDEWKPAVPVLWAQSRFVDYPSYASFITGNSCP